MFQMCVSEMRGIRIKVSLQTFHDTGIIQYRIANPYCNLWSQGCRSRFIIDICMCLEYPFPLEAIYYSSQLAVLLL